MARARRLGYAYRDMEPGSGENSQEHVGVAEGVTHMLLGGALLAGGSWPFAGDGLPGALWLLWLAWGGCYLTLRLCRPGCWIGRWNPTSFVFVWVYALLGAVAVIGVAG